MPIKRFEECEYHDPTSPECLVAKSQMEESVTWKKAAEVKLITSIVEIVCLLVITIAVVFASVAICDWTANHHDILWYTPYPYQWNK